MLGLGLGIPKIANKVITVIKKLKQYWATNTHKWNHENKNWEKI
jgi:hypothetical protein